jgi:hypothetical protein
MHSPESLTPSSEHVARRARFAQWRHTIQQPTIGLLILIFFLATFCFTCFELTLGLVVAQNFHLNIETPEAGAVAATLLHVLRHHQARSFKAGQLGASSKAWANAN